MKVKYTRSSLLFLIAYAMWITVALLKYTYIKDLFPTKLPLNDVFEYTKWLVYVLLVLKFWDDKIYRIRNFVGLAIVFFIGYIEYSVQDNTVQLFMLCIFVYSASNVDFDDILKVTLIVDVFIFIMTVGLSLSGIIPNQVWDEGIRHRYDLGFIYCTFGSHLMLFITMVYSCIRKRITFLETTVLAAFSFLLYVYNNTRVDLCIVIPFLVFFYVWTLFEGGVRKNFITRIMFQYSGVIIAVIAIGAHYFYNPDIVLYARINGLLSNRLHYGKMAIQEYGFSLFGQQIRWIGQGSKKADPSLIYNYVDCSFEKYALNYGIVFLIFLLVGLIYIGKKAIESGEKALCVSLLFLYVFAMVDAELCVLAFHPFLLIIGGLINPVSGGKMKKQTERIIHLDDLLTYIIKQRKIIAVGIIIVGLLFGGIGSYKVNQKYVLKSNNVKVDNPVPDVVSNEKSDGNNNISFGRKVYEAGLYAVKRVILLVFFLFVFFSFQYMYSPRLICRYDLSDMYGIDVFGVLAEKSKEQIILAAEKISVRIGEGKCVMLIGSNMDSVAADFLECMKHELQERNMSVELLHEFNNADSLRKLKTCDEIIMVEKIGKAKYSYINKIIDDICVMKKVITGALIVEK